MDFLWKKDSSGLYVDLFSTVQYDPVAVLANQIKIAETIEENRKNNETSTEARSKGNAKVTEKDWYSAMTYYNTSLCYAEIDSENVCLAYANRSLCFLKLGMYDKCLIDIDLAIKAKYPQRLMPKLEKRRTDCLEQMKTKKSIEIPGPKLDFEADENFPGMANVLQMQYNEKFGRHYIAKCDIDVGKVVMIDKAFVSTIVAKQRVNICESCLKKSENFIACPKCTSALFCSRNCADDILHKLLCSKTKIHDDSEEDDNENSMKLTLRSIVRAINGFSSIDDLMDFVSGVMDGNDVKPVPQSSSDFQSQYRIFLKLNLWLGPQDPHSVTEVGLEVFKMLMTVPLHLNNSIDTSTKSRFLMHLCVMHTLIVSSNPFRNPTMNGIFLLRNHLNHSCAPNLMANFYENKSVCTTTRRIIKGDQLLITYDTKFCSRPCIERQATLLYHFGFHCDCERCKSDDDLPKSSERVRFDPEYQRLVLMHMQGFQYGDIALCISLTQKCMNIVIKYADFPWCKELDLVSFWIQELSVNL